MREIFPFLKQEVSSELKSVFELLETTEMNGELKYGSRVHRKLILLVVCRNYGKAMLELCYLIYMVASFQEKNEMRKKSFHWFFYGVFPASSAQYRQYFRTEEEDESGSAQTTTVSGSAFSICFTRMPVLVELMELMVTMLDYRAVEAVVDPIVEHQSPTKKDFSRAANELSALFYQAMTKHLPAAQQQRKYHQIAQFMQASYPGGFKYYQMGDKDVLEFWKASSANHQSGGDFVKFTSVVAGFMDFYTASKQVFDAEISTHLVEIDQQEVEQITEVLLLEAVEEDEPLLEQLNESPLNRVKFLNKRETDSLRWLFDSNQEVIHHFMLSSLRARLFGTIQNQLIEGNRRGEAPEVKLASLSREEGQGYSELLAVDRKLSDFVGRLLLASVYPLFNGTELPETISDLVGTEEDMWNLRKRSKSEFSKISRIGFEKEITKERVESFVQAIPVLLGIRKRIVGYFEWVAQQQDHFFEKRTVEDSVFFFEALQEIYVERG